MSYKQTLSNKGAFGLQPAPAWIAILSFTLFSALCLVAGLGSIMRYAFPLGSFVVGIFLYLRYPIFYVSFAWWIWFLSPLVTRMVDLDSGWDPQRLMLVSPFLVSLLTFFTFVRHMPRGYHQGGLPFILAFVAVLYGFLIGAIKNPPLATIRAALDWFTPIFFGFHLFINWRDYPQLSRNIQRTFLWGTLVSGIYGVVQYLIAPMWDRFWITETGLVTNGTPEPLGIRVFSTMHSPLPFAVTMMAGLLLLFSTEGILRIPAAVAGYLSFLLSAVRTSWGGWFVGFIALTTSLKPRLQMRLIVAILVMSVCVLPLTTIEPFATVINNRVQTLTSLQKDESAQARTDIYGKQLNLALSEGLGRGLGGSWTVQDTGRVEGMVFDSGILDMFFTLGWFGAIPYLSGMFLLLFTLLKGHDRLDQFANTARAISFGIFSQLALGGVMLSLPGTIFWSFLAMYVAARKYYHYQRATLKN